MHLHIGTSGFAYKEWLGSFYPPGLRKEALLGWYATQLNAVEINSTFYRFPTEASLGAWSVQVPDRFQFAIKSPQRITHQLRLRDAGAEIDRLLKSVYSLGPRLGPLLFQLPPRMPLNVAALRDFTAHFPPGVRAAFEFRDKSWHCEEVYAVLEECGCALCYNDALMPAPRPTSDWGYIRLRSDRFGEADLAAAADLIQAQPWHDAYVFIKHEAPGAPQLARRFAEMVSGRP